MYDFRQINHRDDERLILHRAFTATCRIKRMKIRQECPTCGEDVIMKFRRRRRRGLGASKSWEVAWRHKSEDYNVTNWIYDHDVRALAGSDDKELLARARWDLIADRQFYFLERRGCYTPPKPE